MNSFPAFALVTVLALSGLSVGQNQKVSKDFLRQLRLQRVQSPEKFFYDYNKPVTKFVGPGGSVRPCAIDELPTLAGMQISNSIVDMKACSINLPHVHPRASEFAFISRADKDKMTIGFVEENGGRDLTVDLPTGVSTIFPHALVHFEINPGCEDQQFLAVFSSDDPGVHTSNTAVLKMPPLGVANALRLTIEEATDLIKSQIPGNGPFPGEPECRKKCGLQPAVF